MPEFAQLLDGYRRFRTANYQRYRERWQSLSHGQHPPVMIIACCDSRVDPATIFDTLPGQAFVVRNVANLVPPYDLQGGLHGVSSAIEFGVTGLDVRHIVVMGHGACGGIRAALEGGDLGLDGKSFLDQWLALVSDVRETVLADPTVTDKQRGLELAAIHQSLANLRTFPFVAEAEAAAKLKLHGCHFAIEDGAMSVLDEAEGCFRPV